MDLQKIISTLQKNAQAKSTGYCARFVRLALEAGGFEPNKFLSDADRDGQFNNAADYVLTLSKMGWNCINYADYINPVTKTATWSKGKRTDYLAGDIVVWSGTPAHQFGHIAMYDGSQWISDFKQNGIVVWKDVTGAKISVFRYKF